MPLVLGAIYGVKSRTCVEGKKNNTPRVSARVRVKDWVSEPADLAAHPQMCPLCLGQVLGSKVGLVLRVPNRPHLGLALGLAPRLGFRSRLSMRLCPGCGPDA